MRTDRFAASASLRVLPGCLFALAMLLPSLPAGAQVVRCIDPATGHLTYTDGKCPPGQGATEIAPPLSAAEMARHQEQAQAARERWLAEQALQQKLAPPPPVTATGSAARNASACQVAQEHWQTLYRSGTDQATLDAAQRNMEMLCTGPGDDATRERSRNNALTPGETTVVLPPHHLHPLPPPPVVPQPPVQRLNCNVFRCFDQHGNAIPAPSPGQIR